MPGNINTNSGQALPQGPERNVLSIEHTKGLQLDLKFLLFFFLKKTMQASQKTEIQWRWKMDL